MVLVQSLDPGCMGNLSGKRIKEMAMQETGHFPLGGCGTNTRQPQLLAGHVPTLAPPGTLLFPVSRLVSLYCSSFHFCPLDGNSPKQREKLLADASHFLFKSVII